MKSEITEIITRVLDSTSSATDRQRLIEWMREDEKNKQELKQIESVWNAIEIMVNNDGYNAQQGFNQFKHKLKNNHTYNKPTKRLLWNNTYVKTAAAVVIALGISFLTYQITILQVNQVAYFEMSTPKGSQTKLTLTDGTKIWLNGGSKLKYPNKFSGNTRIIYLEGEGYFCVKRDPAHPFIVKTSEVDIKALGTSFNVKAYPEEGSVETTLISGSVVIEGKGKKELVKLMPNQKATFIKKGGKLMLTESEAKQLKENQNRTFSTQLTRKNILVTKQVNPEIYTSWKDNRLIFDKEPFESIALKLERRYGATIVFTNNEIKGYLFSGKFPEISIDRALQALQYASPFKYYIKNDSIFIQK